MDKGYKLPRYGDNVEALLKKIEDFQENFILMRGCGDELVGGTRRCFFNFSYDDVATPVLADKAVFLSWEDRIANLPPVLAECSYVNLGVTGVTVSIDKGTVRRTLLLTRGTNGEIVVSADESYNVVEQENDPIFTQWRQEYPNAGDQPLSILEIDELCNF